jgi:hypothetical protein
MRHPDDDGESDREAILRRRNRFVAIALSGLTTTATACYDSHTLDGEPSVAVDAGHDTGSPEPCLGAPADAGHDAGVIPSVCLGALPDGGFDEDAAVPMPCLDKAPFDAG